MRRGNDNKEVRDNDGKIFAINLGADFCAEHEWGIKGIRRLMGLTEDEPRTGFNYHTAKQSPGDSVIDFTRNGKYFVIFDSMFAWYKNDPDRLENMKNAFGKGDRELGFYSYRGSPPEVLATAWDEKSFGICIGKDASEDLKTFAKDLAKEIKKGNYAVWFGGREFFGNSGLVVAIADRVPQEIKDYMKEAYDDQLRLEKAAEKTGVAKILESKGKRYYACSPRWKDDKKDEVVFWLNPMEQQIHNYGWFSPAELIDWANGVVGNKIDMKKETASV